MSSGNEYKSVWLSYMPKGQVDLPYPERVAMNIPSHETDGWEFVCMVNDVNGLFRRKKAT